MDLQRNFLFVLLCLVSFIVWKTWEVDKIEFKERDRVSKETKLDYSKEEQFISVKTDKFLIRINLRGGDISDADLLDYSKELRSSDPFRLLETSKDFVYQAQSGLVGPDGPDRLKNKNELRPLYFSRKTHFDLENGKNELRVPLYYLDKKGIVLWKVYIFKRGKYDISLTYKICNIKKMPIEVEFFGQLKQTVELKNNVNLKNNNFSLHSYRGAAYSSDQKKYEKYNFSHIVNHDLNIRSKSGWVGMLQQYFATAWIPPIGSKNIFYTINLNKNFAIIGYKSPAIKIRPQQMKTYFSKLWIGPELQLEMKKIAPYLDLTVDYGWLWFISQPLFKLLQLIHKFVGNWGFSIVIITLIVRGMMYPLTKAQYISIAKMRFLQPKITEIRERVGNDKQKMSQEMMSLYKKEKVNPLGGCLPLLIQMPIFLALYYMLVSSIELRHANFVAWIQDLSSKDPYYILPILMGITMHIIQRISPKTASDVFQEKIMKFTPIVFSLFFLWFPSGLVLYYIVSNIVTIIQQQIIYRSLRQDGLTF